MQDMALIDRFHFYMPGWEVPKMMTEHFSNGYGFVVDYLAEALRELRKQNLTEMIDRHFSLGSHLNARDAKAVRKTVSGLVKLLHPDQQISEDELREYLELAIEGRRRVKEQLKKIGGFEYFQTSFSYLVNQTMEERFVSVPEGGGRELISADPLPPGCAYGVSVTPEDKVALFRVEVTKLPGTGKLRLAGNPSKSLRDSITTAFDYVRSRKQELGIDDTFDEFDYHTQVIDLTASREGVEAGVAFFVALYSLLKTRPSLPSLVVMGQLSIQGNIASIQSLTEPLQAAMENGARRVLLPVDTRRQFLDVPGDVIERVDPIFYADPLTAAAKAVRGF
jgi:ATP-dependent Lon protease